MSVQWLTVFKRFRLLRVCRRSRNDCSLCVPEFDRDRGLKQQSYKNLDSFKLLIVVIVEIQAVSKSEATTALQNNVFVHSFL